MRADRLLAFLLLLQRDGRATARELAAALEVSERTIYRDVDALSTAGVPVYAERGPGGGISLLEGFRTDLTGLTRDELGALFTLGVPAPLAALGLGAELRTALLKLASALKGREGPTDPQLIHLDWSGEAEPAGPLLQRVRDALWEERRLALRYRPRQAPWLDPLAAAVDPYGLVARGGSWYLVCGMGSTTLIVDVAQMVDAVPLEEAAQRPAGFQLAAFWEVWRRHEAAHRPRFIVLLRATRAVADALLNDEVDVLFESAMEMRLRLVFRDLNAARAALLPYGGAVEVLDPPELRLSMADFGRQIAARYGDPAGSASGMVGR